MHTGELMDLKKMIRTVPDFPKPGIMFRDITTMLQNPQGLKVAIKRMAEPFKDKGIEMVVGIEARGFIFGPAIATILGAGFAPIRKPGKLPFNTRSISYELEYGRDTIEIHEDAVKAGQKVLLVDDLLATGGTAAAAAKLVEQLGAKINGCIFVVELGFLHGRQRLSDYEVHALVNYESE